MGGKALVKQLSFIITMNASATTKKYTELAWKHLDYSSSSSRNHVVKVMRKNEGGNETQQISRQKDDGISAEHFYLIIFSTERVCLCYREVPFWEGKQSFFEIYYDYIGKLPKSI